MRKKLFTIVSLSFIFIFCISIQDTFGQTESISQNNKSNDGGGYYSADYLKSDLEQTQIVAYVKVKDIVSVKASDKDTDCVNFTGRGYCSFLLRAEIKELYKGKTASKIIEYFTGGEADAFKGKDLLLGERLVFLEETSDEGKTLRRTLENSTRSIEHNVLEKMRKIVKKNKTKNKQN